MDIVSGRLGVKANTEIMNFHIQFCREATVQIIDFSFKSTKQNGNHMIPNSVLSISIWQEIVVSNQWTTNMKSIEKHGMLNFVLRLHSIASTWQFYNYRSALIPTYTINVAKWDGTEKST